MEKSSFKYDFQNENLETTMLPTTKNKGLIMLWLTISITIVYENYIIYIFVGRPVKLLINDQSMVI